MGNTYIFIPGPPIFQVSSSPAIQRIQRGPNPTRDPTFAAAAWKLQVATGAETCPRVRIAVWGKDFLK